MSEILMAVAVLTLLAEAPNSPGVADVAGEPLTAEDVRRHVVGEPTAQGIRTALRRAADEYILRAEAQQHLSPTDANRPGAVPHLLANLFSPDELCRRIPEPLRRKHFQDTLWRFEMPPAWRVSSIGWRCCSGSGCEHPDAVQCLEQGRQVLERLRAELPDHSTDLDFGAAYDAAAPFSPGLRFKRYSFAYDPKRPDARIHPRLRAAPAPIALAVSRTPVGGIVGPITTRTGHYILRLREQRARVSLPWTDERTQAILRTELCPAVWLSARRQYVADLRRQLPMRVDMDAVEAVFGVRLDTEP